MSNYTPNNQQIYMAAFAGTVGGAGYRLGIPQATQAALAVAQAVDTAWGNAPNTPMDSVSVSIAVTLLMRDTDPNVILSSTVASWASAASAIVAAAMAGDTGAVGVGVSFMNAGGPFNSPFPQQWATAPPANTNDAINRMAALISAKFGPIQLLTGPTGPTGSTGPTGLAMVVHHAAGAILGPTGPT